MANNSQAMLSQRGKTAALSRSRDKQDPELLQARTSLEELKLAKNVSKYQETIARIVEQAPPLTADTQTLLRQLLSQGVIL